MFLIFIALATTLGIYGDDIKPHAKTIQVESMNFSYGNPSLNYSFESHEKNGKSEQLEYAPEVNSYAGIEVTANGLSLGLTITDGQTHSDKDDPDYRPASKVFDIQLLGVRQKYIWNAFYQNYSGFYLENASHNVQNAFTSNNIGQKDSFALSSERAGAGVLFATDDSVNLEYLLGSTSKLKETGNTWVYGLNINTGRIKSNGTIIPEYLNSSFKDMVNIEAIESQTINLEGGWLGQKVWGNYYLNGMFTMSMGKQNQRLMNGNTITRQEATSGSTLTFDTGYRFDDSSLGFAFFTVSQTAVVEVVDMRSSRMTTQFYYRYYF